MYGIELVVNGLLVGMLYSLIALGFVLIYKASDVINFAQGEFVMFGGYIVAASVQLYGLPLWVAVLAGVAGMVLLGYLVERMVLRHLIGQPAISVIMATIGLAVFLQGLAPFLWGIETKNIPLPISDAPLFVGDVLVNRIELVASIFGVLVFLAVGWLFTKSRIGIALRAIADDQQVAQAMGIDVQRFFAVAWGIAGVVALAGGMVWGNAIGVDIQLALVGLKVFPVVILGGLDSVMGALIGGLVIGVVESLAAGYIDPLVGGGTKDLTPYVLMILVLMIKPYGLFGKEEIERV